jgi:predicted GH43/DUF377 family glycosyl hydrolase
VNFPTHFEDYKQNPILSPQSGFTSKGIYNPTVIQEGDTLYMFFRGEAHERITGRIGIATSKDGIHFTLNPKPLIQPDSPFDKFGCEDPRIVKLGDTYYLTYVGNCGEYRGGNICLATSRDLLNWKKHGSLLQPKEGRWNSGQVKAGAILPTKIKGKFVMYFMGEEKPWSTSIGVAYSEDLFNWYEPIEEAVVMPRKDFFDSKGVEPGANPILIEDGILLIYNGWGEDHLYKPALLLFSKEDPTKVLFRGEKPALSVKKNYGAEFGTPNHIVAEGLIKYKNKWLLYYGGADRVTCMAIGKDET